jgi:DNA replication protein DnaC
MAIPLTSTDQDDSLRRYLTALNLPFTQEHFEDFAQHAAAKSLAHVQYLANLMEGEALQKQQRAVQRRIKLARFPVLKTLDSFNWSWPKSINRLQVQHLFRFAFLEHHANVIFLGGVGLGKTHLTTALGYAACLKGHSVLFTTAIELINTLSAAQHIGRLKFEMAKYLKPALLCIDELGYLPLDKTGADLLFQIISHRYEKGSIILTTNRAFKHWPEIFNNDSTITSAVLDRLLHHADTLVIEGQSYRMKEQIDP